MTDTKQEIATVANIKTVEAMHDYGKAIITAIVEADKGDAAYKRALKTRDTRRGEKTARMVEAVDALCDLDETFDPAVFAGSDAASKKVARGFLMTALGYQEDDGEGNLVPTKEYRKYFPKPNTSTDDRKLAPYKKAQTFQSALIRDLGAAAINVTGLREKGVLIEGVREGQLVITHAPVEMRGEDVAEDEEVVIDGSQLKGAKQKKSFKVFSDAAMEAHAPEDKKPGAGGNGRETTAEVLAKRAEKSGDAFAVLINSAITAVNRLEDADEITDDQKRLLANLRDAIGDVLADAAIVETDATE